jgi:hypothetical protein
MKTPQKRAVKAQASVIKTPLRVKSSIKADVTPWWILSGSLLVIGASCVYVAVRSGE